MAEWEYITINLSDLPLKTRAIDVLNDAGKDGWELVAITKKNISYLKRQMPKPAPRSGQLSPSAATT
jgi:Domain of unknown function (DUF4177)